MSVQEEQLIELLLTLKKTTPDQARAILASTPQIAYALVTLMVKMNSVDLQVLQKTLTAYYANISQPSTSPTPPAPSASAVLPHIFQHRTPTPQTHTPPHYNGHRHTPPPPNQTYVGHSTYPTGSNYGAPLSVQQSGSVLPDAFASLPEEQKAMIIRVIAMTPEQVNMLPLAERAGVTQLRTTLGLSL